MQLLKSRLTEIALRAGVEQYGSRLNRCSIVCTEYCTLFTVSPNSERQAYKIFPDLIPIEHRRCAAITSRNMGDRRESEGDPEAYSLTEYLYPYVLRTSKVLLYSLALGKMAIVILLYLPYSTIRYLLAPGQISA